MVDEVDFTTLEETKESYLPEQKAIRSEQLFEQSANKPGAIGIPGALSNQPPAGGRKNKRQFNANQTASASGSHSSRAVRNYEIDRTISHKQQAPTKLQRISVAVIVDYRTTVSKKGKVKRQPLSEEEMQFVTALVREAVGLNEKRGDTINVVNTQFQLPEKVEPLPELPIWEQAWVLNLAKQLLGGLVVLLIAFGVLRPMLKNLAKHGEVSAATLAALPAGEQLQQLPAGEDRLTLTNQSPADSQQIKDIANTMVKQDPKRAASVLNTWVANDG